MGLIDKRKLIVLILVLMLWIPSSLKATHIAGGEFELIHIEGNFYRVNLVLYFDVVSGNPQAFDPYITPWIFRKSDFAKVDDFIMEVISRTKVPYSIQECARGDLITDKILYSTRITLHPSVFNDPQGYRMVWERCCRNRTINNITVPGESGQKFILDFPAVTKNGMPFINSLPILFPPLRDYACINQFYYADFAGQDPDGDSLVYSLVNPLNTVLFPLPEPSPGISLVVNWSPGINLRNVVPGNHALRIDKDGLLTVVPSQSGLFVFAVKVDEYRDGVKIGETRRDFQMLVLDCPPTGMPPLIQAKAPNETEFQTEMQTIKYSREDEKCLEFIVTADSELNKIIKLIAKPVNFEGDISDILSINQGFINRHTDTLKVEVCFPDCPYLIEEPFIIDLLAFDNTCPQGLIDTLRFAVEIDPPLNNDPFFTNNIKLISETINEGDVYSLAIEGVDPDKNTMSLDIIHEGFELEDFGMSFTPQKHLISEGRVTTTFTWDTGCDEYDFTELQHFDILMVLDDLTCDINNNDTLKLGLSVFIPDNQPPVISFNNITENIDINNNEIELVISDELVLDFMGNDFDNDSITLSLLKITGEDGELPYSYTFNEVSGIGNISSLFSWKPRCDELGENQQQIIYNFSFLVQDVCHTALTDTIDIRITLKDLVTNNDVFLPPNVFTPNGDTRNDFFELYSLAVPYEMRLPDDNCYNIFEEIKIFNRWGKEVFSSTRRDFKWNGKDNLPGVYYYLMVFSEFQYKGTVSILK